MDRSQVMRILLVGAIAIGAFTACEEPSAPSAPGGVALEIVTAASDLAAAGSCADSKLNAIQVIVEGPTPDTAIGTPGETVTIGGLEPGTYNVVLVGVGAGGVGCFGLTEGVVVKAGHNTKVVVPFYTFRPVLDPLDSPSTNPEIPVSWSRVPHADGYRVEWDTDSLFQSPLSQPVGADTTAEITVAPGVYHIRVLAVNKYVPEGGASIPVPMTIVAPQVRIVGGNHQIGKLGQTLCERLVAQVQDSDGQAVPDVTVHFKVVSGGGKVMPDSTRSDSSGVVSTAWKLGKEGKQRVVAVVETAGESVSFEATAIQLTASDGNNQNGRRNGQLEKPLVARVLDQDSQAVPGVRVHFAALAGFVSPNDTVSDADGNAATSWKLGAPIGTQTAVAHIESGAGCPASADTVRFQADARAPLVFALQPPASIDGNGTFDVTVHITDGQGNTDATASGYEVSLSLESRGDFGTAAMLTGNLTDTADAGVAKFSGLRLDVPAQGYTLEAAGGPDLVSASSLISDTSDALNVSLTFTQLAAGAAHTCGLTRNGSVYCWGDNAHGQLGIGTVGSAEDVPRLVLAPVRFASVRSGPTANHTCASTSDGSSPGDLYCWGANESGQLGTGASGAPVPEPRLIDATAAGGSFSGVFALGASHTCALTSGGASGQAWCWGDNSHGQLGNGTRSASSRPVQLSQWEFSSIAAGHSHTCAFATGERAVRCWGRNDVFQLGLGKGDRVERLEPTLIAAQGEFNLLEPRLGAHHSCALGADGSRLFCWGQNDSGQLGDGSFVDRDYATRVRSDGLLLRQMDMGGSHTCVLTQGAEAYCVGANDSGQLGSGQGPVPTSVLVPVSGGLSFAGAFAAGGRHTCGLDANGDTYCWGSNGSGQLGDGSRVLRPVPTFVVQGRPVP